MADVELTNILMNLELFDGLQQKQAESLARACTERVLAPGEVLCEVGTVDDRLMVFLAGKLRIESEEGVLLSEIAEVRILGEMGVLIGQTRSSRVVADEQSRILELTGEALQVLVDETPDIAQRMLANLCALLYTRLHGANEKIGELRADRDRLQARVDELAG
ncbi:MAG: cyclic nucleotide-binding domain-containing protein [bacterium]|nr:cyclic nucleotide-binding domain-containing protein [bacterium]